MCEATHSCTGPDRHTVKAPVLDWFQNKPVLDWFQNENAATIAWPLSPMANRFRSEVSFASRWWCKMAHFGALRFRATSHLAVQLRADQDVSPNSAAAALIELIPISG